MFAYFRMVLAMNVPVGDESRWIKEFVLLPMVMTAFDRDMKLVASVVKTPGPYTDAFQRILDAITAELSQIRKDLGRAGIKVYDPVRTKDGGVEAGYKCRGYEGKFAMIAETFRVEAELYMRRFLGENMAKYGKQGLPEWLQ